MLVRDQHLMFHRFFCCCCSYSKMYYLFLVLFLQTGCLFLTLFSSILDKLCCSNKMTSKLLDLIYKFKSNALRNYSILWCAYNPRLISNWPYSKRRMNKKTWEIYKSTFDHRSVKYMHTNATCCASISTYSYWDFCWFLSSNSKMEGKPLSSSIAQRYEHSFYFNSYFNDTTSNARVHCALSSSSRNNSTINSCMKLTHIIVFEVVMHWAIKTQFQVKNE